jgi:hypothetical protein
VKRKRLLYVGNGVRPEWLCDCGHKFSEHSGENNEKCSACAKTQAGEISGVCRADGFTNGLLREVILRSRRRLTAAAA